MKAAFQIIKTLPSGSVLGQYGVIYEHTFEHLWIRDALKPSYQGSCRAHDVASVGREKFVTIPVVDGSVVACERADVTFLIGRQTVLTTCLVLDMLISEFDLMLGIDIAQKLVAQTDCFWAE